MRKGIQEKTSKDVETGQTGKCNIPMYAKGYPGKDKDVETGQTGKCNIPMYAKGYPGKDKDVETGQTGKCNIPMYVNGYQDWHEVPSKKTESRQL